MPLEKRYDDWEEAALNSKRKAATGHIPGTDLDIIKPLNKDAYITRKNMFVPALRMATRKEVDSIRRWLSV